MTNKTIREVVIRIIEKRKQIEAKQKETELPNLVQYYEGQLSGLAHALAIIADEIGVWEK